jgi:flagellar basal body-associated protein FliL
MSDPTLPVSPSAEAAPNAAAEAVAGKDGKAAAPGETGAEAAAVAAESLKKSSRIAKMKFSGTFGEVIQGLKSPDGPTRRGAMLFVFSLLGIIAVLGFSVRYVWMQRKGLEEQMAQTGEAGKNFGDFIKKQSDEAKQKYSLLSLGTYTINLKPIEGSKPGPGVMNIAEVEIQIQCDSKETCGLVDDRKTKVRDEVTNLFTAMEREELLSREGKRRLKKKILDQLNSDAPKGKIEDLFFTKLIIN